MRRQAGVAEEETRRFDDALRSIDGVGGEPMEEVRGFEQIQVVTVYSPNE